MPYVVLFAGVPGSSKSIIAYHLSQRFQLPMYSTDNIRYEVQEDLLTDDINEPPALAEFERRARVRWLKLLRGGKPFIRDGSVDRRWAELREDTDRYGYKRFLINLELSRDFLCQLFAATGRSRFAKEELDDYLAQHEAFMARHGDEADVTITDAAFPERRGLAVEGLERFLAASHE